MCCYIIYHLVASIISCVLHERNNAYYDMGYKEQKVAFVIASAVIQK